VGYWGPDLQRSLPALPYAGLVLSRPT
jgi:hypothetical protein